MKCANTWRARRPSEQLNFRCGDPVVLTLPSTAPRGVYHLDAPDPDLTESERSITVAEGDKSVEVRARRRRVSTRSIDPGRNRVAAFSLNLSPEESRPGSAAGQGHRGGARRRFGADAATRRQPERRAARREPATAAAQVAARAGKPAAAVDGVDAAVPDLRGAAGQSLLRADLPE